MHADLKQTVQNILIALFFQHFCGFEDFSKRTVRARGWYMRFGKAALGEVSCEPTIQINLKEMPSFLGTELL